MKSSIKNFRNNKKNREILFKLNIKDKILKEKENVLIEEPLNNAKIKKKKVDIEKILFFYEMKIWLKEKISNPYFDTYTNYNKLVINNILSNNISRIKGRYTEMLNEIESSELIVKYIYKKEIYYLLKYLVTVHDKFYIQYPNYLKDLKIYNFMSKYLLKKQKILDNTKENNNKIFIKKKFNKLLIQNPLQEPNIMLSNLSDSDSEEHSIVKYIGGQGFKVNVKNSQDSLNQINILAKKLNNKYEDKKTIFRTHSKSFKNLNLFFVKCGKESKKKKIKWSELYEINNKKINRSKKRKRTAVKLDRKKVVLEKVLENNKNILKEMKTKEQIKKDLKDKRKEIKNIKKEILKNNIGKDSKLLDIVKRGFFFINDNMNYSQNNNKKNLFKSSYIKTKIKINENEDDIIKEKIKKNNLNNNYYNEEYCNLYKKRNNIFKTLYDCLNEYRFYNDIKLNSPGKQKFYEQKVLPGLFNDKVNKLLNRQNKKEKSIKTKNQLSIGVDTPVHKPKHNFSIKTSCERLSRKNSILFDMKLKNKKKLKLTYKDKSKYYLESISSANKTKNSNIFSNHMERLENSIYSYYKSNKKERKIFLREYKLNYFNNIKLNRNNYKYKLKSKLNPNILLINDTEYNTIKSKKNIESYLKRNKKKSLALTLENNKSNINRNDYYNDY